MVDYKSLGSKPNKYSGYQTINYCEKLINDYHLEEVENYNVGLGRLFKWLTSAIQVRKQDIIRRKALTKRDIENRENKIAEKEQRA